MDLLNCSEARRAVLDYYQKSGEPQAVQEAIMTSQRERASNRDSMPKLTFGKKRYLSMLSISLSSSM